MKARVLDFKYNLIFILKIIKDIKIYDNVLS